MTADSRRLASGDRIRVGPLELTCEIPSCEAESAAAVHGANSARVANALVGVPDPALETLPEDETVHQLAARLEPHPTPPGPREPEPPSSVTFLGTLLR